MQRSVRPPSVWGDPVRVSDERATQTLVPWDIIAARVLTVRGTNRLTTAVLAFDRDLAQDLLDMIDRAKAHANEIAAELAENLDNDVLRTRFEEQFELLPNADTQSECP